MLGDTRVDEVMVEHVVSQEDWNAFQTINTVERLTVVRTDNITLHPSLKVGKSL